MRILLLSPSENSFINISKAKKTICAALPLLAAYTPKEHEVILANQSYGDNVYLENIDLVGISAMTGQALQGYRIAEHYRQRGVKVVMGGIHASVLPDEAIKHVDAVCIGEGDSLWKTIVEDAAANRLKQFYKAEELFSMEEIPPLKLELTSTRRTTFSHSIVQASRGCPYNCEFCITSAMFGQKYRFRPVDNVIEEIKRNKAKIIFFVDDNIFAIPSYVEELCKKIQPLGVKWCGQASLHSLTKDISLLKLAKKSGAIGFFMGIESINDISRKISTSGNKLGTSDMGDVSKKIKILLDNGILAHTSLIFGLDGDDSTVFEKTVDFLKTSSVSFSSFCILTPYPGTRIYDRFKAEGRLLHEDWTKYCNENVVFTPKKLTPEQLKNGSDWAGSNFYSVPSILKRLPSNYKMFMYYTAMNLFTRKANVGKNGWGKITPMNKEEKTEWLYSCINAAKNH